MDQGLVRFDTQKTGDKKTSKKRANLKKRLLRFAIDKAIKRARVAAAAKGKMKPIDLNKLVEPYFDTGLYLAVSKDNTSVVGTGKTIQDAVKHAENSGHSDAVIMRAPSRKSLENSLRL